jgi:hypothetical protein
MLAHGRTGARLVWGAQVLRDVFGGAKIKDKPVTQATHEVRFHLSSRSHSVVAPLSDSDGFYLSGGGLRATVQGAAICTDEINAALRDGTPLRTLVVLVLLASADVPNVVARPMKTILK